MARWFPLFFFVTLVGSTVATPRAAHAWEVTFPSADGISNLRELALMPNDDPLIGGEFTLGDDSFQQLFVARLARGSGAEIWRRLIHGTATSGFLGTFNTAGELLPDTNGNIGIVGVVDNSTFSDTNSMFYVGKISGVDGTDLWRHEIGEGFATCGALDAAGNVIAAGGVNSASGRQIFVTKRAAADGHELWSKSIIGTATGSILYNGLADVAVDGNGDVAAVGEITNTTRDFFVVKLASANGNEVWRREIDNGKNDADIAFAVAVDGDGNVLAVGQLGLGGNPSDFFVIKLKAGDGTELWRKTSFAGLSDSFGRTVAVDSAGDAIVGGGGFGPSGLRLEFVMKLAGDDGQELWRNEQIVESVYGAPAVLTDNDDVIVRYGIEVKGAITSGALVKLSGATGIEESRRLFGEKKRPFIPAAFLEADDGTLVHVATLLETKKTPETGLAASFGPEAKGKKLAVTDSALAPEKKRKVQVQVKDPNLLVGTRGGAADPTLTGGSLTVINPITNETTVLDLPAANWVSAGVKGYKYADKKPFEGPCTKGALLKGSWQFSCTGTGIAFTLDEPTQGTVSTLLQAGAQRSCARFGGEVKKDVPNADKKGGVFQAKDAPLPEVCP